MLDLKDFIKNKHGQKKYHAYCDICSIDRGYLCKYSRGGKLTGNKCVKCTNSGSEVEISNGFCKNCNINHDLPQIGQSNDYWFWELNADSLNGGYWRCKNYLKNKNDTWNQANPENVKAKSKRGSKKYRSTIKGKLRSNMSSYMSVCLGKRKRESSVELDSKFKNLDWTIKDLIKHLESKFEPNMSWDNYGVDGWEVDHSVPDSWFNYSSSEDAEFKKCWSLENLQPMWVKLNRSKCNKFAGGY